MDEKDFYDAKIMATKIVDQLDMSNIGQSMVAIAMVIEAITVKTVSKYYWLDSIDTFCGVLKERLKDKMQEQNGFEEFLSNLFKQWTHL